MVGVVVMRTGLVGVGGILRWILPVGMLVAVRGAAEMVGGGPVVVGVVAPLGPWVEVHTHLRDPLDVVEDDMPHVLTDVVGLVQRKVLVEGRLRCEPLTDGRKGYAFRGVGSYGRLIAGCVTTDSNPGGFGGPFLGPPCGQISK